MRRIIILAVAYLFAATGWAQLVGIGFVDGNKYRDLDNRAREFYIRGIYDGFIFSPWVGGDPNIPDVIGDCFGDMLVTQLTAIVSGYMDEHPEHWHYPMNTIVWYAFREVCPALVREISSPTAPIFLPSVYSL